MPPATDPNVLVGIGTSDDAGVYRLSDDLALVQTVDFFTPIVDDPYDFGRIAAANALSDIYAMGGVPITALNICAFPIDDLDPAILTRILEGGAAIARAAGVSVIGGHTIKDAEPKYGMAVCGTVHPRRIVTNTGARPGDLLLTTKPLGTGVFSTALKRGAIDAAAMAPAVEQMATLNDVAAQAMRTHGILGATDVTGYGLLGHAGEMARASGISLTIDAAAVPVYDGVLELIRTGCIPGGTRDNAVEHARFTTFAGDVDDALRMLLSDATTSGGLLIAVRPSVLQAMLADLASLPYVRVIGFAGDGPAGTIAVR